MKTKVYVLVCFLLLLIGFVLGALVFQGRTYPTKTIEVQIPQEIKDQLAQSALLVQRGYYVMTRVEMTLGIKTNSMVSWYGLDFHGRKTTSGEIYDMYAMTCAHKTYPMGTMIQFFYPKTGLYALARVNDRGPFLGNREFDVSFAVAAKLGMVKQGVDICETVVVGI